MRNNFFKIILTVIIATISIIFIMQHKGDNLEIFKNTNISDSAKIEKLLYLLDYGKDKFTFDIRENNLNVNYSIELFDYKTLEKNASILFYLIADLKAINYEVNGTSYSFNYDNISLIYNGFSNTDIDKINKRYKGKYFSNIYLGNINGNVDIFDTSDLCLDNYWEVLTTDDYVYYITCSEIDSVIVVVDNIEYNLLVALENEIIQIEDLFKTNLKINRRSVNNEDFG